MILFVWFAGLSPSLARALISTIILFLIKKMGIKMNVLEVKNLTKNQIKNLYGLNCLNLNCLFDIMNA